jgi:hypothetical protein
VRIQLWGHRLGCSRAGQLPDVIKTQLSGPKGWERNGAITDRTQVQRIKSNSSCDQPWVFVTVFLLPRKLVTPSGWALFFLALALPNNPPMMDR